MMNSNTGGTIYLGVGDDAKVHGLTLNMYKVPVLSLSSLFIVIVQFVTEKCIYTRCCLLLYHDTSVCATRYEQLMLTASRGHCSY